MHIKNLIYLVTIFAEHRGWKPSTVSVYAVNDGKLFQRLAGSGGCTLQTAERLVSYLDINWPRDLEWPRDIPRPTDRKKDAA